MPEKTPSGVHAISQQSDEYDGDDMCLFFPVLTVSSRPLYPCYTGNPPPPPPPTPTPPLPSLLHSPLPPPYPYHHTPDQPHPLPHTPLPLPIPPTPHPPTPTYTPYPHPYDHTLSKCDIGKLLSTCHIFRIADQRS